MSLPKGNWNSQPIIQIKCAFLQGWNLIGIDHAVLGLDMMRPRVFSEKMVFDKDLGGGGEGGKRKTDASIHKDCKILFIHLYFQMVPKSKL